MLDLWVSRLRGFLYLHFLSHQWEPGEGGYLRACPSPTPPLPPFSPDLVWNTESEADHHSTHPTIPESALRLLSLDDRPTQAVGHQQPHAQTAQPSSQQLSHHAQAIAPPPPSLARQRSTAHPPLPSRHQDPAAAVADAQVAKPDQEALPPRDRALALYRDATRFEREGNLARALDGYRRATRLFPDIDRIARESLLRAPPAASTNLDHTSKHQPEQDSFQTFYSFVPPAPAHDAGLHPDDEPRLRVPLPPPAAEAATDDDNGDAAAFDYPHAASGYPQARDARRPVLLARLPDEVVAYVLRLCLLADSAAALPLSLACRKLHALTCERALWRALCLQHHRPPAVTGVSAAAASADTATSWAAALDADLATRHGGDWYRLWLDRARVRWEGVYVSRINYVRQGARAEGSGGYSPFLIVTYFRFLRFFPDGSLIAWTTTIEPQLAVKDLARGAKHQKGMSVGSYRLDGGN
ncbi:hypothetical protein HK405_001513, partial [Cladochytrium tenue]